MKQLIVFLIGLIVWVLIGVYIVEPHIKNKAAIMVIGGTLAQLWSFVWWDTL